MNGHSLVGVTLIDMSSESKVDGSKSVIIDYRLMLVHVLLSRIHLLYSWESNRTIYGRTIVFDVKRAHHSLRSHAVNHHRPSIRPDD